MANPFDQFDAPEANPFDQFDAPKPKSPVSGGLVAAAKQAIGGTIKGAGQAAADFLPGVDQDNALKRYGQGVVDANPTAVSSLADLKDKPLTGIAEATGNAGGSMGAMLGARALGMGITAASPLAGPAAPLIAGLGQAVSWAGPAAAAALPSFGGIREKQIQDDPARRDSVGSKLLAAAGAGTVGAIESKFGPNKWAEMALSKQGRDALAEKFVANSLVGSIAKGAAKGAAIEGGEELAQNPIEQLASYQNPLTAENLKDTAFSGVMGALGGGVLGGASGAAFRGNPAKPGQNPDVIPVDQPIPYTPTTVEEVAKARAEAMGIKPENGPLSVASGMAIEGQTAEEMRLSTPGILAQGAAVAEQSRIEQEARQAAEPGIPYDPVAVDDLNGKPATQAAKEASPSPSGSFSQMDELAQLIGQEKADKQSRLADIGAQQQAAQSAADAYREDRLAEINQTVADNRQRQAETARLDLLHGILSDAEVANPAAKFGAELARQGYRNAEATPQEAAAIQRHEDLTQAFKGWQNPATQGPKEGFMQMQDSADFYGLLGREKADLAQRRAALQKPESVPQKKDKHQAVADLVAAGASMKGRDLVSPTGKVVMKNLNLTQAAKARQFIRERNTNNRTTPNAQQDQSQPAPSQAVQAEAQGSQQQSAVDQPAQQEAQNVSTLRPATEGASEGSYPQGSVDARSVGNLRADRGSGTGGQTVRNDAAEPAASVPDSRAGGSGGRVAVRPTPGKPDGSSIDRAVRTLMDRTNGNGSPDGLIGPENQDARAEIISALTGKPAESLSVLEKSLSAMETQLHRAAGITEGSIKERRSRFIDWIDSRSYGGAESAKPSAKPSANQNPIKTETRANTGPATEAESAKKPDNDFMLRPVEIMEHLIAVGEIKSLYKAAGVKSADAFGGLSLEDQANAYAKYAQEGGKPAPAATESYNDRVTRQEREARIRRLQEDRTVTQANGKPFKTEASARAFSNDNELGDTHEAVARDGGFVLQKLPPARRPSEIARQEQRRTADPETQRQEAAFARAEKIGPAAETAVTAYENGNATIEEFEAALDAADQPAVGNAPSPLEALFSGLDSSSVRKANKAKKAAKAHPLADKIQNVQDNFLDILQELEDSGKVKINC